MGEKRPVALPPLMLGIHQPVLATKSSKSHQSFGFGVMSVTGHGVCFMVYAGKAKIVQAILTAVAICAYLGCNIQEFEELSS